MPKAPKTLAAIDKAVINSHNEEKRKHLGASVVANKCARAVFYKWRWAFTKQVPDVDEDVSDEQNDRARVLRLFNRGHREEPSLIAYLRAAGVTVYAAGESGEHAAELRISNVDGNFGGTPDGVGTDVPDFPADMAILLEFKTFNDKQFQKLKSDGVMSAKWEYFIQMQLYMDHLDLPHALFMAVNKNNDELYFETVARNSVQAQHYVDRARTIIYAETPPERIADSPAKWPCKFCDFVKLCHFPNTDFPEVNCRTCAYGEPGANTAWKCNRGRPEVETQLGCREHMFNPDWFEGWTVLDGDFDANWVYIDNGIEKFKMGPKFNNSVQLHKDGLIPF